jgi:predicted nuclease of predicted toxin-antitoxin system
LKILFDQGVPKPLQDHLPNHEVRRAFQLGWADKKNGELLALAERARFELLVTTDQNLQHQQNLRGRRISVFILGRGNWPEIEPHATTIGSKIDAITQPGGEQSPFKRELERTDG